MNTDKQLSVYTFLLAEGFVINHHIPVFRQAGSEEQKVEDQHQLIKQEI
jgi:hypothetical protein